MTDFPTLLSTSTRKSLPLHIPEAWKRYPFRAEPPRIGHHREYSPGGGGERFNGKYVQAENERALKYAAGGVAEWGPSSSAASSCVLLMVRDGTSSSLFDMTVRMLSIATAMMFLPKNNESNSKTFTKKDVLCTNRDVTKSE